MNSYNHATVIKIIMHISFCRCIYLMIFDTKVIFSNYYEYEDFFAECLSYLRRTFNIGKLFRV